jgi:hypothetical protein
MHFRIEYYRDQEQVSFEASAESLEDTQKHALARLASQGADRARILDDRGSVLVVIAA